MAKSFSLLGLLVLAACGQNPPPTPVNPNQLDNKGGTVRSSDERASLQIPGQTLTGAVVFSLMPSNQTIKAPADKVLVSGSMYALGSTPSTTLAKPGTLSIKYDPALVEGLGRKLDVSGQAAANTLEVARLVGSAWEPVGGSSADPNTSTVQAPVSEMGVYALLAPDGSKPVWRLEVRSGVGTVDQTTADQATPLREELSRNFVYISLSRNGQVPSGPVAVQVSGPNGFNTTVAYPANQAWGIYTLAPRQAGVFNLSFSADGQEVSGAVEITTAAALPLPSVTARVVSNQAQVSWPAVAGAQSYEVRLYSNTLGRLQTVQTKSLSANLTIPPNQTGQTVAVMVLAHTWDNGLDRGQPYPAALERINLSASLAVLPGNPVGQPNPGGEANLANLTPAALNLAAATGRSTRGTVSFSNSGSAQLNYTASVSGSAFRVVDGSSGSLWSYSGTGQITVEGTCGGTTAPLTGSLTISSNDPDTPTSTVQLRLECLQSLTASQQFFRAGHVSSVGVLEGSPDGSLIASRSGDGRIILWNASTGQIARVIPVEGTDSAGLAWSPDSTKLAAITNSSSLIRVFNAATGAELLAISGQTSYGQLAWNSAGTQIAALAGSNQVGVYNATSGLRLALFNIPNSSYYGYQLLGFNSDGTRLILTYNDGYSSTTVRVVSSSDGSQAATYDIPSNYSARGAVALQPGGSQVLALAYNSTSNNYRFELRNASTGTLFNHWC